MAGMFQNFMRGMGSLDDRQRALLLAMAAGGSPNPRMQAPLSAASQGIMQSIQEEANRKQREREAAELAAAREREIDVRAAEAKAQREDTAVYRDATLRESARDRKERRADRRASEAAQQAYNDERLSIQAAQARAAEQAATALAEQRAAAAQRTVQLERMAKEAENRGDHVLAARLRGASIPNDPLMGDYGSGVQGSARPPVTADDILGLGIR